MKCPFCYRAIPEDEYMCFDCSKVLEEEEKKEEFNNPINSEVFDNYNYSSYEDFSGFGIFSLTNIS